MINSNQQQLNVPRILLVFFGTFSLSFFICFVFGFQKDSALLRLTFVSSLVSTIVAVVLTLIVEIFVNHLRGLDEPREYIAGILKVVMIFIFVVVSGITVSGLIILFIVELTIVIGAIVGLILFALFLNGIANADLTPTKRPDRRGQYPGGHVNSFEWKQLARSVRQRDGFQCRQCGARNTELHVHHIKPLSEGGGNDCSNLATVCRQCHEDIHGRRFS